jgi:hypothetical protein
VTRWLDEVQTSMDAVVDDFLSVHPVFLLKVRIEPGLDILNDWFPAETK